MKNYLKYANLWFSVLFAAILGYTAYSSMQGGPAVPLFACFFIWVPMAFFFSAMATQAHISKLEKRIESLETNAN